MSEPALSHEHVIELLPMLLAGSLPVAKARAVREHLSDCLLCRREHRHESLVHDGVKAGPVATAAPQPDAARVLGRIDEYEEQRRRNPLAAFVRFGHEHPLLVLVAQAAMVLLVVFLVVSPVDREPVFVTLSEPEALPAGQYIRVVFDASLDRAAVAMVASSMNLAIVDGPGERGIYTLAATPGTADYGSIAGSLRERTDVLFAEAFRIGGAR